MKTTLTVKQPEGFPFLVCDQNGRVLAITQTEENARLIAAVPELLAALQECITDDNAMAWTDKMLAFRRLHAISDTARAAIAKATGKQD
jgi:hypothetical protein